MGAMGEGSKKVQVGKHLLSVGCNRTRYMPQHTHMQVRLEGSFTETSPTGAMGEGSGNVQKASTYICGRILIYVAVSHGDIFTGNVEASSL